MEIFDLLGTGFFAISGVFAVAERRLDWFGAVVVGCVTALGGGTMRGLVLGVTPVFWVEDQTYLLVAFGGSVAAIALIAVLARVERDGGRTVGPRGFGTAFQLLDAAGLALFAYVGAHIALEVGEDPALAVAMGVLTAVGGGVIRDVLSNHKPLVLHGEIYASAALVGALVYVVLDVPLSVPEFPSALAGMAVTFTLRVLGMYRGWSLPAVARGA